MTIIVNNNVNIRPEDRTRAEAYAAESSIENTAFDSLSKPIKALGESEVYYSAYVTDSPKSGILKTWRVSIVSRRERKVLYVFRQDRSLKTAKILAVDVQVSDLAGCTLQLLHIEQLATFQLFPASGMYARASENTFTGLLITVESSFINNLLK